jgi:Tfp pilus assembly protein PilV
MRRFRLLEERGFTLIEVLIASVVLIIGIFGTFALVQMANAGANRARAREGATNLAREVLEDSHAISYAKVGTSGWITSALTGLSGRTGSVTFPNTNSAQTTVARRGVSYTVTTSWCSVDDSKDSYGAHAGSTTWCSDSATTGTADAQPEDFKRVITDITYSTRGVQQPVLEQVATFGAGGAAVGPTVSNLQITTPSGLSQTAPVITANPTPSPPGNAVFVATASGAADVKFSVNGVEVSSGVVNNNNGTWTFSWPITSLKDATYTIGAAAIDALGVRGQARTMPVKLARGAPVTPTNVTGGYNNVWISGVKTQVVELQWDANPEGSVTGYEVLRGGTSVCGGASSLAITCMDPNAPASGTTAYTVKTWYQDSAGTSQSVSTNYSVTAPVPSSTVATLYGFTTGTANSTAQCEIGTAAPMKDMSATFTGGTDTTNVATVLMGCFPTFGSGVSVTAGTVTFNVWYTNSLNKTCAPGGTLALVPANVILINTAPSFAASVATPTKLTFTGSIAARSFTSGSQIVWQLNGHGANSNCNGLTIYYNSTAHQTTVSIPTLTGGNAGTPIPTPSVPTSLSGVHDGTANTNTLTWTAPASSTPAVDFYRIYRDGTNYANRIDTHDATASTVGTATAANATSVTVADATGFAAGQSVSVDTGANQDNVTVSSVVGNVITFTGAMAHAHAVGVPVSLRTLSWVDTNLGGATHTYYVTAVSSNLAESTTFLGPTPAL